MAVLESNRMWSRDAFDAKSERGLRSKVRIQEAYQVLCDPDTSKVDVSLAPDVPQRNTNYPDMPTVFCVDRQFQRVSPILWIASLTYEGEFGPAGPQARAELQPPEIEWTDTEEDQGIEEDVNGNAIVTANGEPIDGATMKRADNILKVKRPFRFFNPHLTSEYRHSVNSDTFQSYPAGTGRMVKYNAKQRWDAGHEGWWDITAEIQFRVPYNTTPKKAWYARVRHEGFYEKVIYQVIVPGEGEEDPTEETRSYIMHAVDDNKEKVTSRVLLAENGTRLPDGADPHYLEFEIYKSLPYNTLGLI